MNVNLLIDSIVRQTTILIAQLATAGGGRPSLANTANQVFVSLVHELKEQGVSNKVIADMFGLALRTYHDRVKRLEESSTYVGRSVWEAVLAFIQEKGSVLQSDVLHRFRGDEPLTVRSVLGDLVDSGLVFRTGNGARVMLRAASAEEMKLQGGTDDPAQSLANLAWVAVNRLGPATLDELRELVPAEARALETALEHLIRDGRVTFEERDGGREYSCEGCVIPQGAPNGWEASVFDHFQGMVTAITSKLGRGRTREGEREVVGGSTYNYWIWDDHPMREEVESLLTRFREQAVDLRQRLDAHNRNASVPQERMTRVIAYVGQTLLEPEGDYARTNGPSGTDFAASPREESE